MPRTINGQVITQTRTWTYSPTTQLLTQTTTPESGTTQFSYNSDGTLAAKTDAKSQQIQYSYDAYGRVVQISRGTVSNGQFTENVPQRTTLAYDGTNGGFSSNTLGRVSQVNYSGPHGLQFTEMYSYHPAGAVTAKQMTVSGTALGSNTANFNATYAYNNLGQVTSVQYPFAQWSNGSVVTAGPQYSYTYDSMNRLNGMTGPNSQTLVGSVNYGAANQVLQLNAASFTETRTYNANLQLASLVSGAYQYSYNYSATQNNGRIQSMSDASSGETITYQYDSLNRLIQASGTGDPQGAWSQTFTFDGFGNLTQKTGSNAPTNAFLATNAANNQLNSNGAQYDANGNLTGYGTGSYAVAYAYDIENRLSSALPGGTSEDVFGYDNSNQRVYQGTYNTSSGAYSNELIYFYGADNKKLACWSLMASGSTYTLIATNTNIWFAGRLLAPEDRAQSRGKYFPFGEDRYNPNPANPSNDQEKFATYTRDSATGLDYAYQRYYNSQIGRFHTPDVYQPSAQLSDPQSWNRYAYVENDPIDSFDPSGQIINDPVWSGTPFLPITALYPILNIYSYWSGEGWVNATIFTYAPWNLYNGPQPTSSPGPDCSQLTKNVGLAGLTYSKALEIWKDGNLGNVKNGATIAALAAVTWQGESSFNLNPKNNVNGPGSYDYGPFQINPYFWPSPNKQVWGTSGGGAVFNGDPDVNIAFGITILEQLYDRNGNNAPEAYTGFTNPAAPKREATYNQFKNALVTLFSNKDCFK
jgi:RHS repeat-associated protein